MTVADCRDLTGRVHMVGIGGAGMSGIARILLARGAVVSGTDAKESRRLEALRRSGIDARVGHDAANVEGADAVVDLARAIRDEQPRGRRGPRARNPGRVAGPTRWPR